MKRCGEWDGLAKMELAGFERKSAFEWYKYMGLDIAYSKVK